MRISTSSAILVLLLALCATCAFPAAAVDLLALQESMVLFFPFDEGAGETTSDATGNQHTGALLGAGVTWTEEGKYGGALQFNGVNGHVNVEDDESLTFGLHVGGESITVMAWLYPKVVDKDFRWIVDKSYTVDGTPAYTLGISSDNKPRFMTNNFLNDVLGPEIAPEQWYHIAGVQDAEGDRVTLYVNGVPGESDVVGGNAIGDEQSDLKIGARTWPAGGAVQYTKGTLDDVAIFARALSEEEVQEAMRGIARILAVSSAGKAALTWADIKGRS